MKEKYLEMIEREKKKHQGRFINIYRCKRDHELITIDLDCGNTPMHLMCHACPEPRAKTIFYKPSMMTSMKYPERIQTEEFKKKAQCEFYRPTFTYVKKMPEGPLRDYVINGGLLIRIKGQKEPMKWV